jgi:hypothetical protein
VAVPFFLGDVEFGYQSCVLGDAPLEDVDLVTAVGQAGLGVGPAGSPSPGYARRCAR